MTIVIPVGFVTSGISSNATPNIRGDGSASSWNSGFDTAETIPASTEGYVQYTLRHDDYIGGSNNVAFGLDPEGDTPTTGYTTIRYSLIVSGSLVAGFYVGGNRKTAWYSFSDGAIGYVIRASDGEISWKVNSTVLTPFTTYNDTVEMKGDGAVSSTNDRIENIILNDGTDTFNPDLIEKVNVTEY